MVVRRNNDQNGATTKQKVTRTLAATMLTLSGIAGGIIPHEKAIAQIQDGIEHIVMNVGEVYEHPHFYNNNMFYSSSMGLDIEAPQQGSQFITLTAKYAGTYTVYSYDQQDGYSEILRVSATSPRIEADTNNDGRIDISEVVAYMKQEKDVNGDEQFNAEDVRTMLDWIDSYYVEPNQAPQFIGDSDKHWFFPLVNPDIAQFQLKDQSLAYNIISLNDLFIDPDMDSDENGLSYHIQSPPGTQILTARIIEDELHIESNENFEEEFDGFEMFRNELTIKATDEHGAYVNGKLELEINLPPFINEDNENLELGNNSIHHTINVDLSSGQVLINLDDYFIDPNNDELEYTIRMFCATTGINYESDDSKLIINVGSISNPDIMFDVEVEDPFYKAQYFSFTVTINQP